MPTRPADRPAPPRIAAAGLALLIATILLAGCGGTTSNAATTDKAPAAVLLAAKEKFDNAGSVHLHLNTSAKPSGGNAILDAEGTLTQAPAFKGDVEVLYNGLHTTIPVVALNGKVYAKLPFTLGYSAIKPADFSAPDPAGFVDANTGISTLLTQLADVKKVGDKRDQASGKVLTTFSGTLSGDKITPIIPSAVAGDSYHTEVGINPDGEIATIWITGQFFEGEKDATYVVTLTDYGKSVKISKP